jgi:hypothetical protein
VHQHIANAETSQGIERRHADIVGVAAVDEGLHATIFFA